LARFRLRFAGVNAAELSKPCTLFYGKGFHNSISKKTGCRASAADPPYRAEARMHTDTHGFIKPNHPCLSVVSTKQEQGIPQGRSPAGWQTGAQRIGQRLWNGAPLPGTEAPYGLAGSLPLSQALLLNGFMDVGADLSSPSLKSWIYPHSTTSRIGTQIIFS